MVLHIFQTVLHSGSGHETTAHTLSWIVYGLTKHPHIQQRCQDIAKQELISSQASVEGQSGSETSYSAFKLLPEYLEAVIKETMRKYTVASRGIVRQVREDGGIDLPVGLANAEHIPHHYPQSVHVEKGTWIMVNFYALHNDANNWGGDAREYKPDRWLKQPENLPYALNSPAAFAGIGYAPESTIFAPFSSGVRNCIGMNMALWEIRSVFARLVSDYHFEFADVNLFDEKKALLTDLTMKPLNQLPVYVKAV
jgi:cytochrome P450